MMTGWTVVVVVGVGGVVRVGKFLVGGEAVGDDVGHGSKCGFTTS